MTIKKILLFLFVFSSISIGFEVNAYNVGQDQRFYVSSAYDLAKRTELVATLVRSTNNLYFYVDKIWWSSQSQQDQADLTNSISNLSDEFDRKIYPTLTSIFGSEWKPGIDKDAKITILFHPMNEDSSGYFRSNDEYLKLQITDSNEKEMLYLNSDNIKSSLMKSFLAHEFMHLVTFNQKEIKNAVSEDVWLDEARAEYAPTVLGYNDIYNGSYLERRVRDFSEKPTGSLIDWQNTKYDYAKINLFMHYLVDHYGINILSDSLKSSLIGVNSINETLKNYGTNRDMLQVFSDWTVAVLINNCNYGSVYCYLDKNLKTFNLAPQINFLPVSGESTLTFAENTRYWAGNWYKIIGGGGGSLKFNFVGDPKVHFKVFYITKNRAGSYNINLMPLDVNQKGQINLASFGENISALYILPQIQDGPAVKDNLFHFFTWSASITKPVSEQNEIDRLLLIIEDLKKQIAAVIAQKQGGSTNNNNNTNTDTCDYSVNLGIGMSGEGVKCLQYFLKWQGTGIYPEGLITGNFGNLTKSAVIRFQSLYGVPQTGFVGPITRSKIIEIVNGR